MCPPSSTPKVQSIPTPPPAAAAPVLADPTVNGYDVFGNELQAAQAKVNGLSSLRIDRLKSALNIPGG